MRWMLLILFLFGCTKQHDSVNADVVEVSEIAKEVYIPKSLISDLEAELKQESKTVAPVYLFVPLQVTFRELNQDTLTKPEILYKFQKGGGSIDLKDVVTGDGSFYMSFPAEQFADMSEFKPELLHMYYISNSPVKNIEEENYGLGCGKYIDLKKSFTKLQKKDFLKLNTTDLRYLHVLAGSYIFIFKQSTKIYITQLTITDSRYSKELCLGVVN